MNLEQIYVVFVTIWFRIFVFLFVSKTMKINIPYLAEYKA